MATATLTPESMIEKAPSLIAPTASRQFLFTVDSYLRMIELDILKDYEKFELLEGLILEKMPHNAEHDSAISRLQRRLQKLLDEGWIVRVQTSLTLERSVPEPDLVVVPGPEHLYDHNRPTAKAARLVIEVSESTLAYDRNEKRSIYAANGLSEYWIVNLVERVIEVYTSPRNGKKPSYRSFKKYAITDFVPVFLDKYDYGSLPVRDIFPR